MGKEVKTKQIKNALYTVHQFPPRQAIDVLMDIMKMIGPAAAPVFSNAGSIKKMLNSEVADVSSNFIGEAVQTLFNGMNKATVLSVIEQLAERTNVTFPGGDEKGANLKTIFDAHFMGELGAMVQWLSFALSAQFSDPLGDLGSVIATLSPAKQVTAKV